PVKQKSLQKILDAAFKKFQVQIKLVLLRRFQKNSGVFGNSIQRLERFLKLPRRSQATMTLIMHGLLEAYYSWLLDQKSMRGKRKSGVKLPISRAMEFEELHAWQSAIMATGLRLSPRTNRKGEAIAG